MIRLQFPTHKHDFPALDALPARLSLNLKGLAEDAATGSVREECALYGNSRTRDSGLPEPGRCPTVQERLFTYENGDSQKESTAMSGTLRLLEKRAPIALTARQADANPAAVYVASLTTPDGRRAMRRALDAIAGILTGGAADAGQVDWARVRFQHAQAARTALIEAGYKPASVNKALSALRGTLKAAWRLGQMDAESYHRAASVANVKGSTLPAGRDLAEGEIRALLACCSEDDRPAGFRDAALIAVLCLGLRRAEAAALDLADYEPESGALRLTGKGRKERLVYAQGGAAEALGDWLQVRGELPGALFWRIRKGGEMIPARLTTQAIYAILKSRARKAGVKHFSPHDLRRTFVGSLLDAGADVSVVAQLAGHASVTTTARYDRRGERAKKKAARMLHVPYRARLK